LTFVDSNALLDALTEDPKWGPWASAAIEDIVYAELAVGFPTIESLDHFVAEVGLKIVPMPRSALYLAAKTHLRYRRAGGTRTSVLPDFFIGAQAAVSSAAVLTRDARRFRTYFPTVELISPETD